VAITRVYLWVIAILALGSLGLTVRGDASSTTPNLALAASLLFLAVVAQHFPIEIGPQHKIDVSLAVYVAVILSFSGAEAVVLVLPAEVVEGVRKHPVVGAKPPCLPNYGGWNGSQSRMNLRLCASSLALMLASSDQHMDLADSPTARWALCPRMAQPSNGSRSLRPRPAWPQMRPNSKCGPMKAALQSAWRTRIRALRITLIAQKSKRPSLG